MIRRNESGFALVITITLLALLVLVIYALSALSKVGSEVAATSIYQTQARQNALLGLDMALGELQRYAREDDVLTGMAGITGVPAGGGNPARHWCGVWDRNGQFFKWLASGENGAVIPQLTGGDSIELVGSGSLGADQADKEHVRALLVPLVNSMGPTPIRQGSLAWWVGDEGVKLSAVIPFSDAPVPGQKHAINELISALSPDAPNIAQALTYEQLALVPSQALTPSVLQRHFHALGRTHNGYVGATRLSGLFNINSTTVDYWAGLAATYNRLKLSGPSLSPSFATTMSAQFYAADPGAGKLAGGPYPSVDLFLNSAALTQALAASGGSLLEFGNAMRPWLTVRSDTFRVRAYGDALNRVPETGQTVGRVEATAYCEAIVQRVKDDPAASTGRYIVTYFRWLGPDDL